MTAKVDKALERLHGLLAAIEEVHDLDLWNTSKNALAIIYLLLKTKQGEEQPEGERGDRHLRLVGKEN